MTRTTALLPGLPEPVAEWFDRYTHEVLDGDPQASIFLEGRVEHSIRVAETAVRLAEELGWTGRMVMLAGIIGLLHDIGRFTEFRQQKERPGAPIAPHAVLGYETVWDMGVPAGVPESDREIVLAGIRYHNTLRVPGNMAPDTRRLIRLVRDADKLDKFHRVCDLTPLPADKDRRPTVLTAVGTRINPAVLRAMRRHRKVPGREIRSTADFYLMVLSLVYVMTYSPTFRRVAESGYVDKIAAVLPGLPEIRDAAAEVKAYLDRRMSHQRSRPRKRRRTAAQ